MKKITKITDLLRQSEPCNSGPYNNDPALLKLLLEYAGEEGHHQIHYQLLKQLIQRFADLSRQLEDKISQVTELSETDLLTGVFNRLKFRRELEREISRSKRYATSLSLIMFDIDHFKQVNDTWGHDNGDEVLIQVSDAVGRSIRETDIFARWGGEEFMILAPATTMDFAAEMADRIRAAIAQEPHCRAGTITASFGVTEFTASDDCASITKRVDNALYRAKQTGRNRVETETAGVDKT